MKIAVGNSQTTSNISSSGKSFGIVASGKAFKILSSSLYNFKPLAVVREISCNARDAHAMCGKLDQPFEVRLPSHGSLHFSVRDFGPGLADEDVMGLYTTYFQSTKAESNEAIGGLGLGSKSPLSYSSSFQVTSYHNGMKRSYLAFQNDNGEPDIYRISESEMEDGVSTGLEVTVPVAESDIYKFVRSAENVYRFFEVKPTVYSGSAFEPAEDFYDSPLESFEIKVLEYEDGKYARFYKNFTISEISNDPIWAKMGDVIYPVSIKHIFEDSNVQHSKASAFFRAARFGKMVVDCEIGELDINAGREGLSYDKATISRLQTIMSTIYTKLAQGVNAEIAGAPTLFDALRQATDYHSFFGDSALSGMFSWSGRSLIREHYSSLEKLQKHSTEWNAAVSAIVDIDETVTAVNYSYLAYNYSGGYTVRGVHIGNAHRAYFGFDQRIVWVIVDEPVSGSKGLMKDRVCQAGLTHDNANVWFIRGTEFKPGGGNKTIYKGINEHKDEIRAAFARQRVFGDVRFLSDFPAIVKAPGSSSSSSSGNVVANGAVREKQEAYFVTANDRASLVRAAAFGSQEFDPETDETTYYIKGNKTRFTLFGEEFKISRSTYHEYDGSGSSIVCLLHKWARNRSETAPFQIFYLNDSQLAEIADNENWVAVEDQLILDGVDALKRLKYGMSIQMHSPGLHDRDVHNILKNDCASYKATVDEWTASGEEFSKDNELFTSFVQFVVNCKPYFVQRWDYICEHFDMTGLDVSWFDTFKRNSLGLYFSSYIETFCPILNTISIRSYSCSNPAVRADLCRLWETTPGKMTIAQYIEKSMKDHK